MDPAIEDFATELLDDDREVFTYAEASELGDEMGVHAYVVIRELKAIGFGMAPREPERRVRGYRSNSHDRWYGPGACRTHGGSGWEQINGFGGQQA